jgi:hypothetical protein
MPIVTVDKISRPEDGVEAIAAVLKGSDLPLQDVIRYDERIATAYPAVQVLSGGFEKEIHGLHTWALTIRVDIYVMHADLTKDRQTRNLEDLQLATQIVTLLEGPLNGGEALKLSDENGEPRVISGWVEREQPGRMPPSGITKGRLIIGTLLSWRGTNEGRF